MNSEPESEPESESEPEPESEPERARTRARAREGVWYVGTVEGRVIAIAHPQRIMWSVNVHADAVWSIQTGPGVVVSASRDHTLAVLKQSTGEVLHKLEGHTRAVTRVALDGELVLSGSVDMTARLWSIVDGRCIKTIADHTSDGVHDVAIHDDWFATCSDETIKVYNRHTHALEATLENGSSVNSVAFLDDDRLVSGNGTWTVTIWDIKAHRKVHEMKHPTYVYTVNVLSNGLVASGDEEGLIKLWDPDTGACLRDVKGHIDIINSIVDTGDGTMTSASTDGTICTWDIATGDLLSTMDTSDGIKTWCVAIDSSLTRSVQQSAAIRVVYDTHPALRDATGQLNRFPNELVACVTRECGRVELMHLLDVCRRTRVHVVDNVRLRLWACKGDKGALHRVHREMNIRRAVVGRGH